MLEQWKARDWNTSGCTPVPTPPTLPVEYENKDKTTIACDEFGDANYNDGYVSTADKIDQSSKDCDNEAVKPFLPGVLINNQNAYTNSINYKYTADQSAGVDSIGLLMGAISMSGIRNIINYINSEPGEELDKYYKMKPLNSQDENVFGLEDSGEPVFYATPEDSILSLEANYRFTKGDLERSTLLVPDISEIRVGDLLVNNNINGSPHVGIVVALLWDDKNAPHYGADIQDWWDKVLVLSIRSAFRMTILGFWGNEVGVFGGFTANPYDYSIRRLVKIEETIDPVEPDYPVDDVPVTLVCDLIPQTEGLRNESDWHWVPNTNEPGCPFEIKLKGKDKDGRNFSMENKPIRFIAPVDFAYNKAEISKSTNIYTNKGKGLEIVALTDNGPVVLVTFNNTTEITEPAHYTVSYNQAFFTQTGYTRKGFSCIIDKNDFLRVDYDPELAKNNKTYDETIPQFTGITIFAVSATYPERIGDDFLLQFDYKEAVTGTATRGDFLAVYDKETLFYANLYIDETMKVAGSNKCTYEKNYDIIDWNDIELHRWPGHPEGNEEGGQIDIAEWTPAITPATADHVYLSVPYGIVQNDTVQKFNEKMKKLRIATMAYYTLPEHKREGAAIMGEEYEYFFWYETTAPGDKWVNYPGEYFVELYYDVEKGDVEWVTPKKLEITLQQAFEEVHPGIHEPVRPQFKTRLWKAENKPYGDGGGWSVSEADDYSSGVDCVRFLSNVRDFLGRSNDDYVRFFDRNKIVPGDMLKLYQVNENGTQYNYHYAFVNEVIFEGDRVFDPLKVNLIESSAGYNSEWRVINKHTWENCIDKELNRNKPFTIEVKRAVK